MYRLIIKEPHQGERRVLVREPVCTVGTGPEADVRLSPDGGAAEIHARLEMRDEGVFLVPAGAAPVQVNDAKPTDLPLRHDDVCRLGEVEITYRELQPRQTVTTRRTGLLQVLALGAVLALIVLEIGVLAWMFLAQRQDPGDAPPAVERADASEARGEPDGDPARPPARARTPAPDAVDPDWPASLAVERVPMTTGSVLLSVRADVGLPPADAASLPLNAGAFSLTAGITNGGPAPRIFLPRGLDVTEFDGGTTRVSALVLADAGSATGALWTLEVQYAGRAILRREIARASGQAAPGGPAP